MKNKNRIMKIIIIIIVIIIALLFFKHVHLLRHFRRKSFGINAMKRYLLSYGQWSIAILFIIYIIKPLFVVTPISVLAVTGGLIYGPIYGTIYTMIGAFLSATVGFYIAKFLGQGFVDKLLKGRNTKIEGDIEKHGLSIMLFLRLAFVFPYDPLSYAAGLSKMKYKHFIIGTVLGVFPEMFAYNYLGTSIDDLFSRRSLVALLIILIVALGSLLIKYKMKKEKCNI